MAKINGFEKNLENFVKRRKGAEPVNKIVMAISARMASVYLALIVSVVGPSDEVLVRFSSYAYQAFKSLT